MTLLLQIIVIVAFVGLIVFGGAVALLSWGTSKDEEDE